MTEVKYWYDPDTNQFHKTNGTTLAPTLTSLEIDEDDYDYYLSNLEYVQPDREGYPSLPPKPYIEDDFAHWDRDLQQYVQTEEERELYLSYVNSSAVEEAMRIIRERADKWVTQTRNTFSDQLLERQFLLEAREYKNKPDKLPNTSEIYKYCLLNNVTATDKIEDILKNQEVALNLAQALNHFESYLTLRVKEKKLQDLVGKEADEFYDEVREYAPEFITDLYKLALRKAEEDKAKKAKAKKSN
ncbi:hypothetical protein CKF54_00825 [Psittacicella hinzii]|uniref:Uncharacterized protein n=1 Tax=Psittacicella hinzii TaxID=2028575 RepID=A0A3A1YAE8_9GAMM|nr:hypothetical protein [Psittacicella hinzii]RIY34316.1 hypothetical protein CKF54_00825 [Psittacicella hinzii]